MPFSAGSRYSLYRNPDVVVEAGKSFIAWCSTPRRSIAPKPKLAWPVVATGGEKVWMVRSTEGVVGPVSLDQLRRGIEAERVPRDAFVQRVGSTNWIAIDDVLSGQNGQTTPRDAVTDLAKLAELRAQGLLTDAEFQKAKAKVLGPEPPPPDLTSAAVREQHADSVRAWRELVDSIGEHYVVKQTTSGPTSGPMSFQALVHAWNAGTLGDDVLVAPPSESAWLPLGVVMARRGVIRSVSRQAPAGPQGSATAGQPGAFDPAKTPLSARQATLAVAAIVLVSVGGVFFAVSNRSAPEVRWAGSPPKSPEPSREPEVPYNLVKEKVLVDRSLNFDDECTAEGKPPVSLGFSGGTHAENDSAGRHLGCVYHLAGPPRIMCCPAPMRAKFESCHERVSVAKMIIGTGRAGATYRLKVQLLSDTGTDCDGWGKFLE